MFNKNVLNNSYTIPKSYSNDKFSNIFTIIKSQEISKKKRSKTSKQTNQKMKSLNKALSLKYKKNNKKTQESLAQIFNADTWVNRLPFLYVENKKVKNYERIYFELIKLFEKKKEDEDDDDHYLRLYNHSDEKNINTSINGLEAYYGTRDYINIIKKSPNVRTMLDVYLITKFLSKTRLGQSFQNEFSDEAIYGKLITFCSMEIKYKKFPKGKKVFNIGDSPDNFYIILYGKVDIIKPLQVRTILTGNEYFLYLMSLLKKEDRYTYNLCIENNDINYVIEKDEEKYLPYIYIAINLTKKKTDLFFKEIISSVNITPKELGLTETEALDDIFVRKNADKIKFFFPYKITPDLIDKYYFIVDKIMQKEVYIYHDQKFLSLETNSHFGDSAMDANTTRNATIIASEDTDVGYIEMNLYHAHISQEKIKLIHKKLKFFLENFFFKRINGLNFEKKYFNFFICNNYAKGDVIFHENEDANFAYFIENGVVELSTSKNVIEMQMIIKILQNKRNSIENYFTHFHQEGQEMLYNNIDNNCGDLLKYINKKEKNKIIMLKNNEDIGLISFFFDCPYISDCVVYSNSAKIYKIDFKYLHQILSNEKHCIYDLIKRINYKLKLFQERFFNINNTKLVIADKEETFKNKEKMDLIRKELIIKERKNKTRNDKSKEKENKAEIEKFQEICYNFFNNKINSDIKNKIQTNRNNLNNSVLPSIKTERILIKNNEKSKNFLFAKIFSRNSTKTYRKLFKNKSQINLLFELTKRSSKYQKNNKLSAKFFSLNKDSAKENPNNYDFNYFKSKLKLIQKEKEIAINNSKAGKKEKDAFLHYFKKYANNAGDLNLSLIFNKIKIKGKDNSANDARYIQISSNINNKNIVKSNDLLFSRNQKLSTSNSNDNIFSVSQKIKSKNMNESTILTKKNNFKILKSKKCSANLLNNEIDKNENIQIKPYTERKIVNKSINHPYYSPSVITKKMKYELFNINHNHKKKEQNKIIIKSIKDFGLYHFASGKVDIKDSKV